MWLRLSCCLILLAAPALAQTVKPTGGDDGGSDRSAPVYQGKYGPLDKAPNSPLYDLPIEVAPGVWSAIGATQPSTYENNGHNNNLSFVIGKNAVLVVNAGGAVSLAKALHEEIRKRTQLPVKYVVNENGQGHAMLGNSYWKAQGAKIIAHEDAMAAFAADKDMIINGMRASLREKGHGSDFTPVDQTFRGRMELDLGGRKVELVEYGPAHSPGDISVIVPDAKVMIAGDIAFTVRMPPIFADTDTKAWLESFKLFSAAAKDMTIIPGHGGPTNLETVDKGTRVYLEYLRAKVKEVVDRGGTLEDAYQVDQSPFKEWHTFAELAARNAGRVFERMEFE